MVDSNRIGFVLNGQYVSVEDPDPSANLADFLRDQQGLKGLQIFCRQGGCGACTVLLSSPEFGDAAPEAPVHRIVNSCLRPLCSVDGMVVTTVEGVGSSRKGLHPVQEHLVKENGTQCGFCSTGMVMSMYGFLKDNPKPTRQEVEDAIDGNLCRCTGYRPILDAFQGLCSSGTSDGCLGANGANHCIGKGCGDIEDCAGGKESLRGGELTKLACSKNGQTWVRATCLSHLYKLIRTWGYGQVRLVRGNTSTGIYEPPQAKLLIDISRIPKLSEIIVTDSHIAIGGAATIADLMLVLKKNQSRSPTFEPILKHLQRVAHPQVRNIASVAGNLVLTKLHGDFTSDVATIFSAAQARVKLGAADSFGVEITLGMVEFFETLVLDGLVVLEIYLPIASEQTYFKSYKVALRKVNAHALINAAYALEMEKSTGICKKPKIVYGGVKLYPQRAYRTEGFLEGKSLYDAEVLSQAEKILRSELSVDPELGRVDYKKRLITSFFFKATLSLRPLDKIPPRLRSVVEKGERPVSKGQVSFDKGDPSLYPVSKPYSKTSAVLQVTGEAVYVDDLEFAGELHAAFVTATVANGLIKKIDSTRALATKGVVSFLSAASIAAEGYCNFASEDEEVFASNRVIFYGQALGLIVATSRDLASSAARLVDVVYSNQTAPILTIEDAIKANSFHDEKEADLSFGSPEEALKASDAVVEGKVGIGHQWHFHLETQRAVCVPGEDDAITVYSSTQNPVLIQHCVSVGLNKPQQKVEVVVKRVGGAYGSKLNRSSPIAMACAYAADKLKKPVRLVLDLGTNMQTVGGRSPYLCKYKVGAQKDGAVNALELQIYHNTGAHFDFEYPHSASLAEWMDCAYNIPNYKLQAKVCKTNLPGMTYMRGPGFVEMLFIVETAIEHTAEVLKIRPDILREKNMYVDGDETPMGQKLPTCNVKLILDTLRTSSSYEERVQEIEKFNSNSEWVKRGIGMVPCKFLAAYIGNPHTALVNVYPDGSVGVHSSGCEIGQGLDIKIAQVAALYLGKLAKGGLNPHDVKIHPTTTMLANNTGSSGGSVTSELAAAAVQDACRQIVQRLRALADDMEKVNGDKPTWQALIDEASEQFVDLQARGRISFGKSANGVYQYLSFGAGVTEVEVDCLTGEVEVLRSDVLLDCGKSLNPAIDIGQVQGAFIQGLGYFLHEEFQFDNDCGRLLTNGTWEYKPPSSKDIPLDFRASLLQNSDNPSGVLRSKFSGEPPYGLAASSILAVRQALGAARAEESVNGWCRLNSPATVENVVLASGLQYSSMFSSLQDV